MKEVGLWLSILEQCHFFLFLETHIFLVCTLSWNNASHPVKNFGSHFYQQATNPKVGTRSEKEIEWSILCNHMKAELLHQQAIPFFCIAVIVFSLFKSKLWHSQFDLGCDKRVRNFTKLNTESRKFTTWRKRWVVMRTYWVERGFIRKAQKAVP